ncbi:MAG TPA: FoF1 ATP synthase subunit a [Dehalococcoidales bacterium]|nr:FoF1 ATP synthase subunit a [Dehalococcoidales bacterium]
MANKRGCLGCSFPLVIGLLVVFLALIVGGFVIGPLGQSMLNIELPGWLTSLSVERPDPHLPAETVFHIFGFPIANSVIGAWITIIFLVGVSYIVTRRMKLVPGRLQAAFEFLIGWLYDLCVSVSGEVNGRRFFPVVATIFLFVGFNAWLALLPGFGSIIAHTAEGEVHLLRAANTDINMPLALAVTSFGFFWFFGFRAIGISFSENFFNFREFLRGARQLFTGKLKSGLSGIFTGAITAFTGFLELLSVFIRVISLTFRLFGNMTAGEILLLVAAFLIPWLFAIPFYGLELLIGFIQAIIFGGLTLIFLTLAVESHGEEVH